MSRSASPRTTGSGQQEYPFEVREGNSELGEHSSRRKLDAGKPERQYTAEEERLSLHGLSHTSTTMLKDVVLPRLLKKVHMQGGA
jgi:hypothetical protein